MKQHCIMRCWIKSTSCVGRSLIHHWNELGGTGILQQLSFGVTKGGFRTPPSMHSEGRKVEAVIKSKSAFPVAIQQNSG